MRTPTRTFIEDRRATRTAGEDPAATSEALRLLLDDIAEVDAALSRLTERAARLLSARAINESLGRD